MVQLRQLASGCCYNLRVEVVNSRIVYSKLDSELQLKKYDVAKTTKLSLHCHDNDDDDFMTKWRLVMWSWLYLTTEVAL